MQLLRKISAATVIGGKNVVLEECFKDKTTPHDLYQVVGLCTGIKTGKDKQNKNDDGSPKDWTALTGSFQATNLMTGEVFRSGVCFMPSFVTDAVAGQLNDEVDTVRFAFKIGAHFDAESVTSYVYDATPLMEPAEGDPLSLLAAQFEGAPALTDQSDKSNA